nr:hypothetical protein [Tanacetum cinerariifolium]
MMVKRIGELEHILADLIQVNKTMDERLDKHGARLYTLEQLDIPQQVRITVSEVVMDAVDWAMQAPLCNSFRDLPEADMNEILHQCIWESDSYKSHEDHMQLFEALEKSMNRDYSDELAYDLAEVRKKRKKGRESPKTPPGSPSHQPPPPPPPAGPSGTSGAPRASGSQVTPPPPPPTSTNQDSPSKGSAAQSPSKMAATTKHQAWTMLDVTLKPLISLTPADLEMEEAIGPDEQAQLSDEEDIERITELKPQDLEGPAYEIVKVFHPDVIHLQYQMEECHKLLTDSVEDLILRHNVSKPLPLGGPPGQVTIQSDFFFNKDLEYMRYGSKGRRPVLSISKMKATYYPDAGLEQMVPDQFWIEEECKYNIAAMYGISHWWFQRQQFYIDRHTSEGDRSTVRTHMRILSVVRIKVFSMYGYDYMKKIVLRRADLNEHVIAERYFKYLYSSDFEDLNLLNLQGHLPPKDKKILTTAVNQWTRQLVIRQRVEDFQLRIESYQTQVNLTKPQWMATGFKYKHDYIVIESPRAVIFRDKYGDQQVESKFKYKVLDQEGRRSVQRIHVRDSEAFEDTENLSQPGELCWRTRQRGRLQTFKAYRLIKLLQHSRPLSDDFEDGNPARANIKQALGRDKDLQESKDPQVVSDPFGEVYPVAPTTPEQRLARKNELKSRGTLLMALPDKHHLNFYIHKVAKTLMEAIEKRNKTDLEEQSLDDLFNSLKIYEAKDKSSSSASTSTKNIAFMSSQNTDSTNEPVSVVASVSAASAKILVSALPNQIDADDLEDIDLKWQMAMLNSATTTTGKATLQGSIAMIRAFRQKKNHPTMPSWHLPLQVLPVQTISQTNDKTGLGYNTQDFTSSMFGYDEMFSFETDKSLPASPKYDRYQSRKGYHAVPPPYTGTFMPPKPNLVFHDAPNVNETIHTAFNVELSPNKPNKDLSHRPSAPIIEDWVSDSKDDYEAELPQNAPSFIQPTKQVKTPRASVKLVENSILAANHKTTIPKPKTYGNNRNKKVCFVCKSLTHLIKDCDYYEKNMAQTPARNHIRRGYHQKYARMTHSDPQRHVVPIAVLTKSKLVPLTTARPVTTTVPPPFVTRPRPAKLLSLSPIHHQEGTLTIDHPLNLVILLQKLLLLRLPWLMLLRVFKETGYVAFGGNPKGGKISGKGKIRTVKLDFDDVYFVKELKFNLFSLPDENQVLLREPRENNMYNVDLKNIVPSGDLTYLFVKKTLDESNLWHRRIGYINFKTMNKLVKGIKREFIIPRTPQQNGIAESKNRTLIEAARTMLTDSLLPIPFWAEAINTPCNVQKRVLVTKPHNKTPYELLLSRTPSIGFMRPFDCPITILNTLDPLGKFDGKADEGFLVGYSKSSKAFRIFNSRTRNVQENLHINFLENKPNVVEKARADNVQKYVLFPLWSSGSTNPHNTDDDAAFEVNEPEFEGKKPESEVYVSPSSKFEDFSDNSINEVNAANSLVPAIGQISTSKTNTFSAAGPSNTAVSLTHGKSSYIDPSQYPDDPKMPALEDITYSDGEEDVGAKADFTNLETNITVSSIPTTKVHKDYPVTQIIGDLSLATQIRKEPKRIHQALKDPSWIEAMQEELLQFKMQKVWVLVDLPNGKRAIGTKWVFRNKKDERGIVVRNKARLVTQGYTQEEGIDYEELFALVARIEAIRLFLAYASFMGFMVYQMDVKSAFLYETIKEKVYVYQPLGFEDSDYPDKKPDGIFISQDKYVAEILRKFSLTDGKSASTPIDTEKPLLKDPDGKDVDVHTYRSMIGSLMYLTSSRLDIMFAVYSCACFQVTSKVLHLHAVKRIFRYLKGTSHLGLWYPKDLPFNLVAYSDSDYAGVTLDWKSTTGVVNSLDAD